MSSAPAPAHPRVALESRSTAPPALVHDVWLRAFPWLVQGTTVRDGGDGEFDLGLFAEGLPEEVVRANWARLAREVDMPAAVHARQPHGQEVRIWDRGGATGLPHLQPPCDGHVTDRPGVLLAVTVADCVPAFVVDPARRVVGMIHAGWRGAAAGVLQRGLEVMDAAFGTRAADVHVHLGPSICGSCYEVGPEVFRALGQPEPQGPEPIDLRGILAQRAVEAGVQPRAVTVSGHCTRCTGSGLFSHRGGDACRQVGYLGIRAA